MGYPPAQGKLMVFLILATGALTPVPEMFTK